MKEAASVGGLTYLTIQHALEQLVPLLLHAGFALTFLI